ncbi:MAG: hypothetical protein ACRCSU_08000 [Paracoccaceae bacterium]
MLKTLTLSLTASLALTAAFPAQAAVYTDLAGLVAADTNHDFARRGGDDDRGSDDRGGRGRGGDDDRRGGRRGGDDRNDDSRSSGRKKPRVKGGSGCDDAHDIIEHAECR